MASSLAREKTAPRLSSPTKKGVAHLWTHASPRFWTCLVVLVLSAAGLKTGAGWFGWFFRKEAVPLKKPLQLFDARELGPRYELNKRRTDEIPPMTEDMIDGLGTDEYLQIFLTDRDRPVGDPTRVANLFVTYHTGRPDMVPHVPDECYLAGGYDKVSQATEMMPVPGSGAPGDRVPVRVMEFRARRQSQFASEGSDVATVMYFFHANGGYTTTRNGVRASMSNPFQRYAYYAKIEVTFSDGESVRAGREASVGALGPLLERVMPVLLEDHFDLDKLASADAAGEQAQQ